MGNSRHLGLSYAHSRYAEQFLIYTEEYKLARVMLGEMANKGFPGWTQRKGLKYVTETRRKLNRAKDNLDKYRRRAFNYADPS